MACGATLKQPMEFEAALLSPGSPKGDVAPRCWHHAQPPDTEPLLLQAQLQLPLSSPGRDRCLRTLEQIFQNIKQEYSHYQRWRQLEVVLNQSEACTSEGQSHSSGLRALSSPGSSWMKKDQPTFTLGQVGILYECLLKDYEDRIREEYEQDNMSLL